MKTTTSFITTFLIVTLYLTLTAVSSQSKEGSKAQNLNSKYFLDYSDLDFQIYAQSPDIPPGPHTVPSQIKVVLLAAAQQDLFLTVPDGKDNTTYISRELTAALNSIRYKVPNSETTSLSQRTASAISSARKRGESPTGKFCGEKICLQIVK